MQIDEAPVMGNNAQVLSDVMQRHGISQRKLAMITGLHAGHICKVLQGDRMVSLELVRGLYRETHDAELMELALGEVINDQPEREAPKEPTPNLFQHSAYALLVETQRACMALSNAISTKADPQANSDAHTQLITALEILSYELDSTLPALRNRPASGQRLDLSA